VSSAVPAFLGGIFVLLASINAALWTIASRMREKTK